MAVIRVSRWRFDSRTEAAPIQRANGPSGGTFDPVKYDGHEISDPMSNVAPTVTVFKLEPQLCLGISCTTGNQVHSV